MKNLKLSDSTIGRIINILQESMIAKVDILDLMREMRLTTTEEHELILTEEYVKKVDVWHKEIEAMLIKRQIDSGGMLQGTGNCNLIGGTVFNADISNMKE